MIEYQGSRAGFGRRPTEHGKSTPVAEFSLPRVFFFAAQKEGWAKKQKFPAAKKKIFVKKGVKK